MTSNPGDCGPGHEKCVGGVVTCVPDRTMQSCYSGTAGSAGKGLCRAGTQSCIGTLGPCQGEVTPREREDCFTSNDEDCDGQVNNGCPTGVTVGAVHALATAGGTGGDPQSARCPAGSFVIRAQFLFADDDAAGTGVRIFRGRPTLVQGSSGYTVAVTPTGTAADGIISGSHYTPPDDEVDCGSGFVAGYASGGAADQYVYGFGMFCATGSADFDPSTNTLSYTFRENGTGRYTYYNKGHLFDETCAPNEVLVGWDGRAGYFLDQITPLCAPLATVY